VTLARFLDLHRGVTGEEPEPLPSQMDRCGVCSEKAFCERCAHCDKKVCEECKEAHIEILTREISRINNQVRRGLNKLTEHSQQTGRNNEKLQLNHKQIREEITESVRRFIKDLKDKESKLLHDLDEYTQTEAKNVEKLKEDLDQEVVNITSNCELVEKHVTENDDWSAAELVEYKEIFLKTLEFLRNLDPDTSDFARKIKFQYKTDMDVLRRSLIDFGELKITTPNMLLSPSESGSNLNALGLSNQNNLMRSQSDHRLAAQFQQRRQGESRYLDVSGSQSRLTSVVHSDSERDSRLERNSSPTRRATDRYGRYGTDRRETADESRSRYLREADLYVRNWPRPSDSEEPVTIAPATQFRSRFMRERNNQQEYSIDDSHDSDFGSSHRSVRFEEPAPQPRPKVFETEGAARGPLSGVIKLTDSPHVMERLHQNEIKQKLKEQEAKNPPPAPQPPPPVSTPVTQQQPRRAPSRQVSEDEIEKQKKMNQVAAATNTTPAVVPQSPVVKVPQSPPISESPNRIINRRVTTLQREDERANRYSPDSSRRGSDSSLNIDDSQLDEESGDTSGIARLARRRVGSNNEESDTTSRATTARQPSSPRQVSSTPSTPSSPSTTTTTTTTPTSTTITCATTPSTITTSTTSIPTTTCSTSTTSTTYVERKEEPVVKKDSTALKFRIVSKALTSPSNSLQSNNSIENETESSTRLSDLYSSRTSAKSPYVRQSSDVRFDKPTNSSLTGYSPLLSSTSRRSPTPTYVNSSTNHKASDASTNLLYPTSSSIASRDNSRSGSPELRRVNLADFRGQERPNYNPYRQARPNLSLNLNHSMPITREEPLIRTSYTPTTSTLTSIPQQSSYRHTLSSLGFPDSSNEREIITQSFDWGISVLDYICYSIGFIIFITVIIYRSVRSPLGKNLSLTHPEVNDVNSDNKNIVRHTIGSDKKDSRTVSTSDSSESNASNDSSGETDSESDEEDISAAIDTNRSNTTAVNETQHRSERIIELPASVSSLLNRSAQARKDNLNAINRTDSPTGGIGGIGSSGQGIGRFSRQSTLNDETNTERPTYKGRKPLEPSKKEEDNSPSYQPKRNISRGSTLEDDDDQPNTTANSTYSRFLSRSRTSAAIANKEDSQVDDSKYSYARRSDKSGSSTSPSSASTYRSRLAKSRSSHSIQGLNIFFV
jgi:hypothetical protein